METSLNWYVVYTKSRNEKKVAKRLQDAAFEIYCPLVTTVRQWSDRKKKVTEPLFKSYVFVRSNESQRLGVLQTPGVVNFVFWLGKPAIVRQEEIEAIRSFMDAAENVEELTVESGENLKIDWGLFRGQEGKYLARQGDHLILLVESLGRMVRAKVPVHHVKKTG